MGLSKSKHKINDIEKEIIKNELDAYKKNNKQLLQDKMALEIYVQQRIQYDRIIENYLELYKEELKNKECKSDICCICMEEIIKKVALIPCGHTAYCNKCIRKIDKCALCKSYITNVMNIY